MTPLEKLALAVEEAAEPSAMEVLELAAKGKLDWSPKHNWVEDEGGLPKGIEDMAVHMMDSSGLTREHAIAASVQRAKILASKPGPTQARWIKEVAQWEKMKASAAAKRAAKKA